VFWNPRKHDAHEGSDYFNVKIIDISLAHFNYYQMIIDKNILFLSKLHEGVNIIQYDQKQFKPTKYECQWGAKSWLWQAKIINYLTSFSLKACMHACSESTLRWPKKVHKYCFSKLMQLSTSTKLILKEIFIIYTQNEVVQLLSNAIIKGNYIFWLILNNWRIYLWENKTCNKILQSANIFLNDSYNY
jgi:hypothetical protein